LQTEADMERASAATEHSDPAGVELAPADADEWDVGLAHADAHEPNGDAVADADADASGAAPAGFAAEPDGPDEPDADVGRARWVQGDNRLWAKRNEPKKLPLGPPPPHLLVAAPDDPSDFEQHFFGGPFWAPRAWAHGGPGPVHSSPVRSHDECDQLDSAWRQAGCRFADCRLQICRLQSAVLSNPTLCRQAADLQIADFVYPKPLRWQAGRRFADLQADSSYPSVAWAHGPSLVGPAHRPHGTK
jgi:hypothetical protein